MITVLLKQHGFNNFNFLMYRGAGKTTYIVSASFRCYGNGSIWQPILT
jgi:hypothetical protein